MTRRSRLRLGGPVSMPVVLPHIIVRPDKAGTVTVALDGEPVSEGPIPRVQLGEAISQIVDQVATAVRVEVHEPDGTVHADILTPSAAHQPGEPTPPPDRPYQRRRPSHAEIWGGGSGEVVHVGAVVATAADASRNLRVELDPRPTRNRDGRMLAVGSPSGAAHTQEPA